jgi:hypothetical protein
MEATMALPYKTGGQDVIHFVEYFETRPVGVILSVVKQVIETKSLSSFVIPFAGVSAQRSRMYSFPLRK